MLARSMGHNAFAQTLDHRKTARKGDALMVVQATTRSKCAEGLDTSTSSTRMPTEPQSMTGAAETLHKTNITKSGMPTWAIVILQVSYQQTDAFLQLISYLTSQRSSRLIVFGENGKVGLPVVNHAPLVMVLVIKPEQER